MACSHNASKIVILETQIKALERDISDLEANIEIYKKAVEDYSAFYEKIKCVERNIVNGDNHITGESLYDNGDMSATLKLTMNQIDDCTSNFTKCKEEIASINESIVAKKAEIDSLQGDCSSCAYAKKLALDEKQQHS